MFVGKWSILWLAITSILWAMPDGISIIEREKNALVLEISLPALRMKNIAGDSHLHIEGWSSISQSGMPQLPVAGLMLQAPVFGDLRVQILDKRKETKQVRYIVPAPSIDKNGREISIANDDIYRKNALYPDSDFVVEKKEMWRGIPVQRLIIHPLRWNPATGDLQCYEKMRLRISWASLEQGMSRSIENKNFEEMLSNAIVNYRKGFSAIVIADHFPITDTPTLKIETAEAGIYRITGNDLQQAGVVIENIEPATLSLYHKGQEIAVKLASSSEVLQKSDYLEFYADDNDNKYYSFNVYQLQWGQKTGLRMPVIKGTPQNNFPLIKEYRAIKRLEQNNIYWRATPGIPQSDPWFQQKLTAPAAVQLSIPEILPANDGKDAMLRVCFRGRSTAPPAPNHHTLLSWNNYLVSDNYWNGNGEYIQEAQISANLLQNGENNLKIELPGDSGAIIDVVYINWAELHYQSPLQVLQGQLLFDTEAQGGSQIAVSGLEQEQISIYDITEHHNVKEIQGYAIENSRQNYRVIFEDIIDGRRKYAVAVENKIKTPQSIELTSSAHWKDSNRQADYLIITCNDFAAALTPLVERRESQGLRTRVVTVEEIYHEFNNDIPNPQAIKDFVQYAYRNWQKPAPAYLLMVGDANLDYRNYLNSDKINKTSTHLSISSIGYTPDDNWYGCVDGIDSLPELFVGRLPGKNREMVAALVDKILFYEDTALPKNFGALFVADNGDSSFESLNENLSGYPPQYFQKNKIYLGSYPSVVEARADLLALFNKKSFINYTGHGDVLHWAGEKLFHPSFIPQLQGSIFPFVSTFNCLNGYFAHSSVYCMAEELVAAPDRGAIACFSPSGYGYTMEFAILAPKLYGEIFRKDQRQLGVITTQSKVLAYSQGANRNILIKFHLLGDPALKLREWSNK